jgi:hypothetical protein
MDSAISDNSTEAVSIQMSGLSRTSLRRVAGARFHPSFNAGGSRQASGDRSILGVCHRLVALT